LFVFSIPNPAVLAELEGRGDPELETHFTHPQSGNPVQVSSAWEQDARGYNLYWHYDHLLPDGQVERRTISNLHYPVPVEVHLTEVKTAGLSVRAVYGDFDFSSYMPEAPHMIVVGKRE
jgi:hypothetical protein